MWTDVPYTAVFLITREKFMTELAGKYPVSPGTLACVSKSRDVKILRAHRLVLQVWRLQHDNAGFWARRLQLLGVAMNK